MYMFPRLICTTMIDITHEQQSQQPLEYGGVKNGYRKKMGKMGGREECLDGVTFEGDIHVLYYNEKKE